MGGYHGRYSFETFSHMYIFCILNNQCRKPVVYKTKWPGIKLIYDFPLLYFPFAQWKKSLARLMV